LAGSSAVAEPAVELLSGINKYLGLRVGEVQIQGLRDWGAGQQHVRELIVQAAHEPLDRRKLRQSIHALYATGRYSDVQVEVEHGAQDELTLVFLVQPNYFIGTVTVEGLPKHLTSHQVVNASKLRLGELYTREKMDTALRSIQAVIKDNGFYQAKIADAEEFHSHTQQVDIRFHLTPGPPARIGQVGVRGDPGFSPEEVESIARFHAGDALTAQKANKGLQRVRKQYQKEHRLEAQVAVADEKYRAEDNTLDYVFQLDRGPTVDVRVEGARLSMGRLKKLVPVFEEGTVDDDLLNEGARNLRDHFQTQGFFMARVSWRRQFDSQQNRLEVVYHVDLGGRHSLVAIEIEGNHAFDTELIRERMQVKPVSNLLNYGLYSESMLSHDIDVVEDTLYKANGFSQVRIEHAITDDYKGTRGHLLLTLRIQEGPQIRVGEVKVTGNRFFTEEDLRARLAAGGASLATVPGQPFSDSNLAQDRDMLMGVYFNQGFPEIQVDTFYAPAEKDPSRMNVTFAIHEGGQVFVDQVLVSGLNYTRPYVVSRRLQVKPDAPLRQQGMLDSQRALYDLGLFNEVQMAVQNPEGKTPYKNVLFQLREAQRWTFNYGIGFEVQTAGLPVNTINTAPAPGIHPPKDTVPASGIPVGTNVLGGTTVSPSVSFEVTRLNFRGRDDSVTLKTHVSSLQERASFTYAAPHWFDHPDLRLTFTGLYDNSRNVRTFSSERLEGAAQLQRVISRRGDGEPISTLLFRYSYRRVKVDASTLAISPALIPLLSKPVLIGMPSVSYIRDRRDNVLDAHRGNYTTVDAAISAKAFGSGSVKGTVEELSSGGLTPANTAANFTRLVAQNSTYTPIWRNRREAGQSIVFARTTRLGIENVLGGSVNTAAIPLPERFFSGGADSDRGFALNQAGPRDLTTGFPLGGGASFLNSFELRFPPPRLPWVGDNLSFVLFHDAGNVFNSGTEMLHSLTRWHQPNGSVCVNQSTYQQCRFDYMSQAPGGGIRYRTPIGPVRADVSYNLSPPSFPYFVQCPSKNFPGEAPPCSNLPPNAVPPNAFQYGTLRHLNFFFSIGQSF
jgi:outer membrane protein assembly factor BamA